MDIFIFKTKNELGKKAASDGAEFIRQAIAERGSANIILATGASQFEMLAALVKENVDWSHVTGFHLDEYIGMPETHPASFRKYLKERFVEQVPIKAFHFINGENDAIEECKRVGAIIRAHPVDVAFIGIGENGHLAFNDPPADFETEEPYIIVKLDDACRRQQLGEGWFKTFADVPDRAISMSIRQIMKSRAIICTVPDARKAEAVKKAVEGSVSPLVPASILQQHPNAKLYLDENSAALLTAKR
ncbi:MAG: glucosamine-6-phosphate deaminase [candidate division KSB1 bacterium]|nr:glucosamine-6-phosphate deaminase [candidate division KSB1 bacterium]MDZ7376655.1 glucosamine-6-phosphate deaminase [candidate division KSB1 bacterium]MDZ7400169.1 glucosamine-6-phosphate deaminase [candidate division KSB1 bacterium]